MKAEIIKTLGTWSDVYNACRTTIGLKHTCASPSSDWKRRLLLAEHSPIRKLSINWIWKDIKYWVSVHLVRHKFGIEHFVRSQRPDRKGTRPNRDDAPQGSLIEHEAIANAQAIINISRKRLCHKAMPETRQAWIEFLTKLSQYEPEIYAVCVPDCIYRGWCYELESCGYFKTDEYKRQLQEYRHNINM